MAPQFVYRVRPGFTHGPNREFKEGDEVIHTEAEARGFLDKLQLVGPVEPTDDSKTDDGQTDDSQTDDGQTGDSQTDPKPAKKRK